ncbi:MAG: hypothetical protein ACKOWH_04385 [Rhodoluna sp.]
MIRKSAYAAFIAALALILMGSFGTSASFADDKNDETGVVKITSDSSGESDEGDEAEEADSEDESDESPEHQDSEIEKKHKELDDMYGKQPSLTVPPLVIRPYRDSDDKNGIDDGDDGIGTNSVNGSGGALGSNSVLPGGLSSAGLNFIAISPRDYRYAFGGGISPGTPVNPEENSPITIQQISFDQSTPAEVFLQASQVGLYVMGAGAVALGVLAGASIIRRK